MVFIMENNELRNISDTNDLTGFSALRDVDFNDLVQEELGNMKVSFDRIGTPGAEGRTFKIPGINPGETDNLESFTAVILHHHAMSFYFSEPYRGKPSLPDCKTYDGWKGTGTPGGMCENCPLNEFGSGPNGGKACRNKRRLYLLREGEVLPVLLSIPTGSLGTFGDYVKRLLTRGMRPSAVVTRFSVLPAGKDGPAYSKLQFSLERILTPEEEEAVAEMARQVRIFTMKTVIEEIRPEEVDPETGNVDPETGEILPQEG